MRSISLFPISCVAVVERFCRGFVVLDAQPLTTRVAISSKRHNAPYNCDLLLAFMPADRLRERKQLHRLAVVLPHGHCLIQLPVFKC